MKALNLLHHNNTILICSEDSWHRPKSPFSFCLWLELQYAENLLWIFGFHSCQRQPAYPSFNTNICNIISSHLSRGHWRNAIFFRDASTVQRRVLKMMENFLQPACLLYPNQVMPTILKKLSLYVTSTRKICDLLSAFLSAPLSHPVNIMSVVKGCQT